MDTAVEQIAKLVGLGSPFLYASGIYYLFHYVDARASLAAKEAISNWFKPLRYDRAAISEAIVEVFGSVYSQPLLSWRAFLRSAVISILVTGLYFTELHGFKNLVEQLNPNKLSGNQVVSFHLPFLFNVLTDYVSLFIVRRWLNIEWRSPWLSLFTGTVCASLFILLAFYIRVLWTLSILVSTFDLHSVLPAVADLGLILPPLGATLVMAVSWEGAILPALAVLLWLPLFAFGAALLKTTNYVILSVTRIEWFLDRGNEHPFEAIGYVAAVIVFAATVAISILGRTLS